jgi:ABC-type polar amino acid transport system ATPase subunit
MHTLNHEGMTQIVVTHELRFVRDAADFVFYMEDGHMVEGATPDLMFRHPQDERTRHYLKRFL